MLVVARHHPFVYRGVVTSPRKRPKPDVSRIAVGYARVSTDEQRDSGLGLTAQREAMIAECHRRGWQLAEIHSDEGISGGVELQARPGLRGAVEAILDGRAGVLVAAKSDRLARSLRVLLTILEAVDRAGGVVVACDGTIDCSTTTGKFVTHIMGCVSELERNLISERTRAAMKALKDRGVVLGRPRVVPDDVVERIKSERAAGSSLGVIARGLNEDNIPTAHGGRQWWKATVARILDTY